MQIGENIRRYRKKKNMTQEEMANRLGVTPPAVNKWENGNSCPDIALLAPIARLLDISVDTLLSFQSELTREEIAGIIQDVDAKFQETSYEEAFQYIKKILEKYPNSEQLTWQLAMILDAWRLLKEVPDADQYDGFIVDCFQRALQSTKEEIHCSAAESLYNLYVRKEQYEEARKCLEEFSVQNPERKRRQAELYRKTGQIPEAYRTYEELLFTFWPMVSMTLQGLYLLAVQEQDMDRARYFVEKQSLLGQLFDYGTYYAVSSHLELAVLEKDEKAVLEIAEKMLSSVDEMRSFVDSPLYAHLEFQKGSLEFYAQMRQNLLNCFRDEEGYGFMKGNTAWERMLEKYENR